MKTITKEIFDSYIANDSDTVLEGVVTNAFEGTAFRRFVRVPLAKEEHYVEALYEQDFGSFPLAMGANHFRCIDMVIDNAMYPLSETLIKRLHLTLKNGTSDSRKDWFAVGEYKRVPNEVGGRDTTAPEKVEAEISELLSSYNAIQNHTLEQIIAFHHDFECIHPFQDGNGRIGRLILFKECLKNNIVPFIIEDNLKMFYYRGLHEWNHENGYLVDTCLTAQDRFKAYLDYFRIPYGG